MIISETPREGIKHIPGIVIYTVTDSGVFFYHTKLYSAHCQQFIGLSHQYNI